MTDLFKNKEMMPREVGERPEFPGAAMPMTRMTNLNDADVVRSAQTPADMRSTNAAAYPAYTALSVRNLSPRHRGKHY